MKKYFITGIGTGIGKTIVSAIFVEALKADYWKPVQVGNLECTDTDVVKNLVSNNFSVFHPESFKFKTPASPHFAAEIENRAIDPEKIIAPQTTNHLVIEGAGGLLVPLTINFLLIDLIHKLNAEVILVSQNYLGSINHTLLSVEALRNRNIPIYGIVFNGESNSASEMFIQKFTDLPYLLRISQEESMDKEKVREYANKIKL